MTESNVLNVHTVSIPASLDRSLWDVWAFDGPLAEFARAGELRPAGVCGRRYLVEVRSKAAAAMLVGCLLYEWEERASLDGSLYSWAHRCNTVGVRLARTMGVGPEDLPRFCGSEARTKLTRLKEDK